MSAAAAVMTRGGAVVPGSDAYRPRRRAEAGEGVAAAAEAGGDALAFTAAATDWMPPTLGRGRPHPLRAGLPARLPPDRQPARRRGPHPGRVRPGLPVAVQLHARHLRGLAAPHHDQPLPRPGPPQAAHPLRRRSPTTPPSGCPAASPARPRSTTTTTSTTTSSARSTRSRPTSARPSCSATSRACPTRRSQRRSASSSGTVRSRIHRGRAQLRAALEHRAPGRREAFEPGGIAPVRPPTPGRRRAADVTHLGPRISALVDGELGHEARDRALAHVAHCADLPRDRSTPSAAVKDAARRGRAAGTVRPRCSPRCRPSPCPATRCRRGRAPCRRARWSRSSRRPAGPPAGRAPTRARPPAPVRALPGPPAGRPAGPGMPPSAPSRSPDSCSAPRSPPVRRASRRRPSYRPPPSCPSSTPRRPAASRSATRASASRPACGDVTFPTVSRR